MNPTAFAFVPGTKAVLDVMARGRIVPGRGIGIVRARGVEIVVARVNDVPRVARANGFPTEFIVNRLLAFKGQLGYVELDTQENGCSWR
jgi:hypothetical protein